MDKGAVSSGVCDSCGILVASSYSWEVTEAWGGEAHELAPLWLGKADSALMEVLGCKTVSPHGSGSPGQLVSSHC